MNDVTDSSSQAPSQRWRHAVLILLVVILHTLVLYWSAPYFSALRAEEDNKSSVSVVLHPLPLPEQPVSLPVAPRSVKRSAPSSSVKKSTKLPSAATPAPAPINTDNNIEAGMQDLGESNNSNASDNAGGNNTETDTLAKTAATTNTNTNNAVPSDTNGAPVKGTEYQVDPPPSAQLIYDVLGTYNNLTVRGTSSIAWKTDGQHFSIDGITEDFFFTFLSFQSQGEINAFGVAPELYTEKKIRRSATNTHFNRERNLISFSSSTVTYPLVGGEQDRASLIWQLASIGRGDSTKFAPGATIDLFVAGVRDGEIWRMQVIGLDEMKLPAGAMQAWHVVRQPRPGSYDQQLDIWFSPEQQWYPVRLRFTETNGDYLDLSLSRRKNL